MAKVVVTFKLEEDVYSRLKDMAAKEGRGVSEILRESLTDWMQSKKQASTTDLITFIKGQKNAGKSWAEIASAVRERHGVALDREQLKSLSK